jgi:hypothetical protein
VIAWYWLDLQLPVLSVCITTKVVNINPPHGEVYSIQHYVNKVCQLLATGRWISQISSINKTDHNDIHVTEILWKVALNMLYVSCCTVHQHRLQVSLDREMLGLVTKYLNTLM